MRGFLSIPKVFMRFFLALAGIMVSIPGFSAPNDRALNSLTFSVLKTAESNGSLEAMVVDGGEIFDIRQLVHTAVLVRHPKGDILWDTGIGTQIEQQLSAFSFLEGLLFSIQNVKPAYQQLVEHHYNLDELTAIIPSHLHWDHASGLEDFIGVPVWVQQNTYEEAMGGQPPGFVISQYDSPAIEWQKIKLADKHYRGFKKSHDIYDDGSAVLVDLSGHTHGQFGLFLTLQSGKSYFFIGDTTWVVEGIQNNKSRPAIVDWLVGVDTDVETNAKVIDKIHQLSQRDPELVIVPAHDERQLKRLPVYPEFLQKNLM